MGQESPPKVPFPIGLELKIKLALFKHELNVKLEPRNPTEITIARPR